MPPRLPRGVEQLPSGAYRARFRHAGINYRQTFDTPRAAAAWIQRTRGELASGLYIDPDTGLPPTAGITLGEYAAQWVAERDLKPRTRSEYRKMLDNLTPLDGMPLARVTRDDVKSWWTALDAAPTSRKHHYELLRAIFNSAVDDEHIDVSPVRIAGAAKATRKPVPDLPTATQVHALADAMPTDKYRTMVLVSAWCGLRFGESTELRRKDIIRDEKGQPVALRVRRGVVRVDGTFVVGTPKSAAGVRDVAIPPHIRGDVRDYLDGIGRGSDSLLFPGTRNGTHMAPSSLYKPFYAARKAVGLPGLRWHDLRHFSATTAAQAGATLAELQARLGHSTVHAAMRYQHAAAGRDAAIAEAMSNVAPAVVRPKGE
jgi:integrase